MMAEEKTLGQKLPVEVTEKIISMIPFPNLFKARTLSKRWSSAFSSNPVARTFQYLVKAVSSKWEAYCPVYVTQDGWLTGYDYASERWKKLLTLSYFLRKIGRDRETIGDATFESLSGPLLCGLLSAESCCSEHGKYCQADVFVTNVITRDWKVLPLRNDMEKPDAVEVCASGPGVYKVMVLTHPDPPELKEYLLRLITFQFYDSEANTWTLIEMKLRESLLLVYQDAAYSRSHDKFYAIYRDILRSLRTQVAAFELMVYDLKNVSCKRIQVKLPPLRHVNEPNTTCLVECEGDLLVVLVIHPMGCSYDSDISDGPPVPCDPKWDSIGTCLSSPLPTCSVMILKVDLENQELIPLARGPPYTIVHAYCKRVIGHEGCIYLLFSRSVVVYNVRKGEWSSLFATIDAMYNNIFLFQPGLDPFVPL